jgi:ubiquinone/menaquinone biosynthesis C-methylase UbiE
MTFDRSEIRVFSDVDQAARDRQASALDVLDRLAALPAIRRVRATARTALDVRPGRRLLDAGCGVGEEARELARMVGPDGEVTAVDLSAAFIATARERDGAGDVRYAVGDITALDFPDATFDGVRSERVLQHVADPDVAVAELLRVLRPGGRVCLVDTDWESFVTDGLPEDLVEKMWALGRELGLLRPAGRLLRGRLLRAGVREVAAEPVTVALTERAAVAAVHPAFDEDMVRAFDVVPGELMDAWFAAFDAALDRGDFLAAVTFWVVTGVKEG